MIRIITWLVPLAEKLPRWLRPAFLSAAVLFALVGFRMLFAVPLLGHHSATLREIGLGFLAAAAAGAAGGLCYTFLGKPLVRVPVAGPYLAGVVMVGGYVFAVAAAMPLISLGEPVMANFVSTTSFAVGTVLCGLLVGVQLAKPA